MIEEILQKILADYGPIVALVCTMISALAISGWVAAYFVFNHLKNREKQCDYERETHNGLVIESNNVMRDLSGVIRQMSGVLQGMRRE